MIENIGNCVIIELIGRGSPCWLCNCNVGVNKCGYECII
jgi:hypothetical protein